MSLLHIGRSIFPSAVVSLENSTLFDPATGECVDIDGCRTVLGILWSCLSVIFICTWVAIHPNIPKVGVHPAVVFYQDLEMMLIALLVPEFMILWAMRQRTSAKAIGRKFKKYGWGMTHGFFVLMGGFALYDGDKFCGYLWHVDSEPQGHSENDAAHSILDGVSHHSGDSLIEHSLVDKGNDAHAKDATTIVEWKELIGKHHEYLQKEPDANSLAVPQAIISAQDTEIDTEKSLIINNPSDASCLLEFLVAKGYTTLTANEIKEKGHANLISKFVSIVQSTWFILQVAARAAQGLVVTELEIITVAFAVLNFGTYFLWWNKPLRVRHPVRVCWRQIESKADSKAEEEGWLKPFGTGVTAVLQYICFGHGPKSVIGWISKIVFLPLLVLMHLFRMCIPMLTDDDVEDLEILISSKLPDSPLLPYIAAYGIAAIFGAIHCIPWVFQFPTHTEHLLWRISAIAIATAPIAMGLLHVYIKRLSSAVPRWWNVIALAIIIVLSVAYAVFRIMLITIAFTALRHLPSSAYQTAQWTIFIPHIG
ncbi:hypothetical protein VNI00_013924 [Paramarasmius palmivorus]|uniref:Uncharacterized protein n=1 Tax=Paramarasmius palmivorus TaxID=297713 RepID=A0AAW0BXN4_9AGAR